MKLIQYLVMEAKLEYNKIYLKVWSNCLSALEILSYTSPTIPFTVVLNQIKREILNLIREMRIKSKPCKVKANQDEIK
jgi:hypothetical protein